MDAKPQRLRAPTRQRDENMPPSNLNTMGQTKTLHHSRNKSTPALSSLLKNPVKTGNGFSLKPRQAFADVSNTSRGLSAQDDLALVKEGGYAGFVKPTTSLQPLREVPEYVPQTKNTALLRPAQRPLSAMIPKQASSLYLNNAASAMPRHVNVDAESEKNDPEVLLKFLKRKGTTVFREEPAVEPEVVTLIKETARTNALTAPVHQILEPREKKLPPAPETILHAIPIEEERVSLPEAVKEFSRELIESIEQTFAKSEQTLPVEEVAQPQHHAITTSRTSSQETIEQVEREPRLVEHEVYLPALETQLPPLDPALAGVKLPLSAISDVPEEYYEEEDDEYYDAEGYTTARSIRSRGDNTTGGLTTFLEPRVTARVMKELQCAAEYVDATRSPDDVEDEAWDTSMVAEYGDDIFEYMRKLESKMRPNEHYMDNQNEIQWSMRSVLMDWMIQVHTRFGLLPETLFLAVNYIDRFLSCKVVSLGKLQLVGATALFVAAKYEEINCPSVQEIVYMVDNAYTVDEILKAERFMLSMLQFELGWPGPMSFLRRISKADEYDLDTRTMAKYFLEVMIMDERFVACPPSFAAAGAHCLSRLVLDKGDWTIAHTHYSQYTWSQLHDLVAKIVECCSNPRKHHLAVYDKYQEKKYKRCALVTEAKLSNREFKLPPRMSGRESSVGTQWIGKRF